MSISALALTPRVQKPCTVYYLGVVAYEDAAHFQERLVEARYRGEIGDTVLILEHFPVFTVGRAGYQPQDILVPPEKLEEVGIRICHASRGGGITYHGPGQLVSYPIFNLRQLGLTVRQYLTRLEEVVISTLEEFGISGVRHAGAPGVWVNGAEIASIGIHVSGGITEHGFTLNVSTDLTPFSYIAVCGVPGKKVTSVAEVSASPLPVTDFIAPLIRSLGRIFHLDIQPGDALRLAEVSHG